MRLKRIRDHYTPRVDPKRQSYDILDWSSEQEQTLRFEVLLDILRKEHIIDGISGRPLRVLDVGCGLADLKQFLEQNIAAVSYFGIDITPAILHEAMARRPGSRLVLGDVFYEAPFRKQTFDVVFCSGLFNLDLGNNHTFVKHALGALFELSRHCMVVNFLHVRSPEQYPHCCYFDPAKLVEYIPKTAERVDLIDDYLEKDFTIAAIRDPRD